MKSTAEKVVAGDIRAVARLIRDIDDGMPEIREVLKEIYPYTGKAYVIGITGAPGAGKSTLVDRMITHLRKEGKTVGVLAVDPTSPFCGGAILGDRIRMQRHSMDEGVFIRSLATRGHFGGLTQSTRGAIDVLDAMGKDFILVETVGVGQDEVEVVKSAHTTIIVVVPGMGDDVQAIKAGILEAGDIFLINKADREGAEKTASDLRLMIDMDQEKYRKGAWKPPILKAQAVADKGVAELVEEIHKHGRYLFETSDDIKLGKKRERVREELTDMVEKRILEEVINNITKTAEFDRAVDSIVSGDTDPYTACEELVLPALGLSE
ncbi:MAG TPA: methylmalonyl Co-A mutase-associated GTPase MeaB [Desulfobacteraceae bacterium]|nr:methylmalonyl Co-A mutase-associated GTPase MeaB [Desulfobacteraceae bacterium]